MSYIWHIAYQGLPKYQISFPLTKVSESFGTDGRGGGGGDSSLGKITLKCFWLRITTNGSIFPENPTGN